MASNSVIINTQYQPFSYQELLAPVAAADAEYKLVEQGLAELAQKTSIWDPIFVDQDTALANTVREYGDSLRGVSDSLSQEGLNSINRNTLNKLRSQYMSTIQPVETAFNRRMKFADEQREHLAKNPTAIFDRLANEMTLEELIANPTATYSSLSGSELTKEVAAQVIPAAQALLRDAGMQELIKGQFGVVAYNHMMQSGFIPDEVIDTIMGVPEANRILTTIRDNVLNSSGVANWGENALRRATDYADQGLWQGVGKLTSQVIENPDTKYIGQDWVNRREHDRRVALANGSGDGPKKPDGDLPLFDTHNDYVIAGDSTSSLTKALSNIRKADSSGNGVSNEDMDVINKSFTDLNGTPTNPVREYERYQNLKAAITRNRGERTTLGMSGRNNFALGVLAAEGFGYEHNLDPYENRNESAYDLEKPEKIYLDKEAAKAGIDVNNLISNKEYKKLKKLGFSEGDSPDKYVQNLETNVKRYTLYDYGLKPGRGGSSGPWGPIINEAAELSYANINKKDNTHLGLFTELDDDYKPTDKKVSHTYYEKHIKDQIAIVGDVPSVGVVVIADGKKYKLNTESISNSWAALENEYRPIINAYLDRGNFVKAQEYMTQLQSEGAIKVLSGWNQEQGLTSSSRKYVTTADMLYGM